MNENVRDLVDRTPFVDTHEHLIEESDRVAGRLGNFVFPCNDWAYLFWAYTRDDLTNAGMPVTSEGPLYSPDASTEEKFRLIAPYWDRVRHTGYGHAVRLTIRKLYGEEDLTKESAPRIAEMFQATIKPGFYRTILRDHCNIEFVHVNSLEKIFAETDQPDLLKQDLSILGLSRLDARDFAEVEATTGNRPVTLDGWLAVIDQYFATYAPRAVAVKSQIAYSRNLDFEAVSKARAAALFPRIAGARDEFHLLGPDDIKALQDFLFRYCVEKASEYRLPVKLHTGYFAGRDFMSIERLKRNASDVCRLLIDFPDTNFVLMHIGYPYQHEFMALAKHFRNAYVDMCWSWIINPAACVRFVKEFLSSVPSNKLLTFGGDHLAVEPVFGHSRIARQGIAIAISELIANGWIHAEEAPALIDRIMRGNARELFPSPQTAG